MAAFQLSVFMTVAMQGPILGDCHGPWSGAHHDGVMKCPPGVQMCGYLTLFSGLSDRAVSDGRPPSVHGLWLADGWNENSECHPPKFGKGLMPTKDPSKECYWYPSNAPSNRDKGFVRHEWQEHGKCAGVKNPDDYFVQVCALATNKLDRSPAPLQVMKEAVNKCKGLKENPDTCFGNIQIALEKNSYPVWKTSWSTNNRQVLLSACARYGKNNIAQWQFAKEDEMTEKCGDHALNKKHEGPQEALHPTGHPRPRTGRSGSLDSRSLRPRSLPGGSPSGTSPPKPATPSPPSPWGALGPRLPPGGSPSGTSPPKPATPPSPTGLGLLPRVLPDESPSGALHPGLGFLPPVLPGGSPAGPLPPKPANDMFAKRDWLVDMGFDRGLALAALNAAKWDHEKALEFLLQQQQSQPDSLQQLKAIANSLSPESNITTNAKVDTPTEDPMHTKEGSHEMDIGTQETKRKRPNQLDVDPEVDTQAEDTNEVDTPAEDPMHTKEDSYETDIGTQKTKSKRPNQLNVDPEVDTQAEDTNKVDTPTEDAMHTKEDSYEMDIGTQKTKRKRPNQLNVDPEVDTQADDTNEVDTPAEDPMHTKETDIGTLKTKTTSRGKQLDFDPNDNVKASPMDGVESHLSSSVMSHNPAIGSSGTMRLRGSRQQRLIVASLG